MKTLAVVVGIVMNEAQQVLVAKRRQDVPLGGLWEFPGGKQEAEESPQDALKRELWEEVDIHVEQAVPLLTVPHTYDYATICLQCFHITAWHGTARGKESQIIRWVSKNELAELTFPSSNQEIIEVVSSSII